LLGKIEWGPGGYSIDGCVVAAFFFILSSTCLLRQYINKKDKSQTMKQRIRLHVLYQ
jgi:hypothetical protein